MKIYIYDEATDTVKEYEKEYKIRERDIMVLDAFEEWIDLNFAGEIVEILGTVPSIKLKIPILNVKELMEYRSDQGICKEDIEIIKLTDSIYIWQNEEISKVTTKFDRREFGLWRFDKYNCLITGIGEVYEEKSEESQDPNC